MAKPDADKIISILEAEGETAEVFSLDTIDSTNSEAKRYAQAGGKLPVVITADEQSAGRGRMGRSFFSPAGTGVYVSIALDAGDNLASMVTLTSAAAVAVCRAIERSSGLTPGIKWVNDLYLNGGKVCGILAESFPVPGGTAVVVGVGINVTTDCFPPEVASVAASLESGGIREELIALTASGILSLSRAEPGEYMDEYRARSVVLGKEISFFHQGEEPTKATAIAIDDEGGLVVRLSDGSERTLKTGEISVRLKED